MPSPAAERAIEDAIRVGRAILKFLSPNDVGATKSHQRGYLIPNGAWQMFSPHPPVRGENRKSDVHVTWPDGADTDSVVTWYGATKQEYRLTNFGRRKGFPWLTADLVGSLLVLVPVSLEAFLIHVLDLEDDIEDVQAALDVQLTWQHGGAWTSYERDAAIPESEDDCINRQFREALRDVAEFPDTTFFSETAWRALRECIKGFAQMSADDRLLRLTSEEFRLYRMAEQRLRHGEIHRLFPSVDEFIKTALRILNARKSRAGRSLENHVEFLLRASDVPLDMRVKKVPGQPDVLIPGVAEYNDKRFPVESLFAIGVKTTCKDRWRQVLREAPRVQHKYILTMQGSISRRQLDEMAAAGVSLIVPKPLHDKYPKNSAIELLTLDAFIKRVRSTIDRWMF